MIDSPVPEQASNIQTRLVKPGRPAHRHTLSCCMNRLTSPFREARVGLTLFGSGLIFLFISQVITGVALALVLCAYRRTTRIPLSVHCESGYRGILHPQHPRRRIGRHNPILLLLHVGQTILYRNRYKGRRDTPFLSGCILLALMLATGLHWISVALG